jgi:hypothetical protein
MTLLAFWKQQGLNPCEAMAQSLPLMAEKKLNTHAKAFFTNVFQNVTICFHEE